MKSLYNKCKNCKYLDIFKSSEARYILKYSQFIMVFILGIIAVIISHSIAIITSHAENTLVEIGKGYNDLVDKDYYCKSIECRYIYQITDDKVYSQFDITNNEIVVTNTNIPPKYIMDGYEIYLPIYYKTDVYYVYTGGYLIKLITYIFGIYVILILFILYLISGVLRIERDECLSSLHSKESDLQHNILFNITANINHEVNSPLLVVKSVIDEIEFELRDLYTKISECSGRRECEPVNIFKENMSELIELASESVVSIESVIRPLSDYKSIKFTNGDRSVYMLTDIAMKMLRRTNISNFQNITIDSELNKYSIAHDNGMSNGFFLNLMINHIKNSLESSSTKISVSLHKRDMEHLYIYITDNGNGIPTDMIDKIYEANVTTKASIDQYRRGVGLYLSKLLINKKYEGDDTLVSSIPGEATTFCVKIRYEKFKYYKGNGGNHGKVNS